MDKLVVLETLLAECSELLDRCQHELIADLDEKIAQDVLGWHMVPGDTYRIWRTATGDPVEVIAPGDGKRYKVCQHPWIEGINTVEQLSYSPGHNYHPHFIDWVAWTRNQLSYSQ
ncbi:hypothetical protein [Comamonas thiooxydans]|uniref:hypothetical protein n=1 Tax=Comamonas thiooxydans TaxID=363952 RepID=UPI001186A735|nr:hypothetical protein [Comamonas thiooxydans]